MSNKNIYEFSDKISENYIQYEKDGKNVWINNYYVDENNGKLFTMMLKESFSQMKKKGCEYHFQIVDQNEWISSLSKIKGWKFNSKYDDQNVVIYCHIDDAPFCIMKGILGDDFLE